MTGPGLSTSRSISNTPADHVADHNTLHQVANLLDLTIPPVIQGSILIRVNDYATPQLALDAAPANAHVLFQGSYALTAALLVKADGQWIDASGASFTMATWATPVFDAIDRDSCTYDLGTVTYTGTRGNHLGASIRGQSPYSSGCAVWINGDRNNVRSGKIIGMPTGAACFSSWDGTGSYDRQGVGNKLGVGGSIEVSGYDFGVLPIWQKDLTIQNMYAHDDIDDSGGANPTHSIYVSPTSTAHSSGLTISNVRTVNNLFGQPIQVKYTDGLVLDNISADNSKGLCNLQDCVEVEIGTMVGTNSLANGGSGAFTTAHTTTVCSKIRITLLSIQLAAGNDERAISFWADDSEISALHVETNHSGAVSTALSTVVLRGDRGRIKASVIRSLGSHMRGLLVGFGATLANDWVVADPIIRGPRGVVDVVGGSLRNKIRYDPALQTLTGAGTPITVTGTPVGGETIIETAGKDPQIDVFTATGTWTKPTGAVMYLIKIMGSGAGGGAGRRGAAGSVRCGGGGGAGGAYTQMLIAASQLGATVTATVGTGGTGGAAITADDTNGNNGGTGVASSFGPFRAYGGVSGGGGTATSGSAGAGNSGMTMGGTGGTASATGGVGGGAAIAAAAPGGGAGGGITSANAAGNGGTGQTAFGAPISGNGTAGGVVDTTPPSNGGSFTTGQVGPGASAGGGAGSITTAAQAGGNGGNYGAGGAGGGASLNGNNSGKGGDGAPGIIEITTYFQ